MPDHDVVILGAGPTGTTAARLLTQRGIGVTVFDREAGPTFKIGESLLPEGIRLCHQLGLEEQLHEAGFVVKNGARFILTNDGAEDRFDFQDAWRADRCSFAYQVKRQEFDALLARHAESGGADIQWSTHVRDVEFRTSDILITLGDGRQCTTRYIADATGPAHFLAKRFNLRRPNPTLRKVSLFTHCAGIPRASGRAEGDITILWSESGWFWVIPFSDGITSVGLIGDQDIVDAAGKSDQERFDNLCSQSASHKSLFDDQEQLMPVQRRANWAYRCDPIAGENFVLLGDAAGFIDPVFSTGVYLGQQGAFFFDEFLGPALAAGDSPSAEDRENFNRRMRTALDRFQQFVNQFYDSSFVDNIIRSRKRAGLRQSITSLLAGDVFYEDNPMLRMGII